VELQDIHAAIAAGLEAKSSLFANGETITQWAKRNGFNLQSTYRVLNGRSPCLRGETHRIAVALGIKPAPDHLKSTEVLTMKQRGEDAA
jgi:gp16 family phage-associated protein